MASMTLAGKLAWYVDMRHLRSKDNEGSAFEHYSIQIAKLVNDHLQWTSAYGDVWLDADNSTANKLIFRTEYKHKPDDMEARKYRIVVTPSLMNGIKVRVIGKNVHYFNYDLRDSMFYELMKDSKK